MPKNRILPVFVPHAGCPCRCVFCDQKTIAGQMSPVTPDEVRRQVRQAQDVCGGAIEIAFYGGSFTAIAAQTQEELLGAAAACVQEGLACGIRLSTRPDCVGDAVLERLRRFGVGTVELGAQSMDDGVLRLAGRGHTAEDTVQAVRRLRESGFAVVLQLMVGLPGDSDSLTIRAAQQAAALQPDGVRIYPVVVLPGTALEAMYRTGAYMPLTVSAAVERVAPMLELFEQEGVPVLRVGLQPEESLGAAVVAGPYHPALGELCRGALYRRRMEQLLLPYAGRRGDAVFSVPRGQLSQAIGQKRCNILALQTHFDGVNVQVVETECNKLAIAFTDGG